MKDVKIDQLTPESIAEAIEKYDRIIRPKALVVSPKIKEQLLEAHPETEHKVKIVSTVICGDETAYLMDRKYVEDMGLWEETKTTMIEGGGA